MQVRIELGQGSFIVYIPKEQAPDYQGRMQTGRGREVTVRGLSGYGAERVPETGSPAVLRWYEDGIEYVLAGPLPLSEYLRMAESMP